MADFIFGDMKITADGDCYHEIKKTKQNKTKQKTTTTTTTNLLAGRKVMTNLDSILKSIDITSQTKIRLVNAMVSQ